MTHIAGSQNLSSRCDKRRSDTLYVIADACHDPPTEERDPVYRMDTWMVRCWVSHLKGMFGAIESREGSVDIMTNQIESALGSDVARRDALAMYGRRPQPSQ